MGVALSGSRHQIAKPLSRNNLNTSLRPRHKAPWRKNLDCQVISLRPLTTIHSRYGWNIERFSSGPAAWTSRNAGPRWRFAVLDEAVGGPKGYGYYELLMPLKAVGGPRSWGP
jgi:hypothetical protein